MCEWLKEIGMEEYRDSMRSNDVGGAELLTMKTSDISVSKNSIKSVCRSMVPTVNSRSLLVFCSLLGYWYHQGRSTSQVKTSNPSPVFTLLLSCY